MYIYIIFTQYVTIHFGVLDSTWICIQEMRQSYLVHTGYCAYSLTGMHIQEPFKWLQKLIRVREHTTYLYVHKVSENKVKQYNTQKKT